MYIFWEFVDLLYILLDVLAKISIILIAIKYLRIRERIRTFWESIQDPSEES